MFGNLGFSEIVLISVIALIVFGPKRLPEIARNIGRTLSQFRRAALDLRETVEREVEVSEMRQALSDVRDAAGLARESLAPTPALAARAAPASPLLRPLPGGGEPEVSELADSADRPARSGPPGEESPRT